MTAVLSIEDLTISLPPGADRSHAVQHVSLQVERGELLCLVGESGSGKSIIAHTVMGLLPNNIKATGGAIRLNNENLLTASVERRRELRGTKLSMIFQEPMTALNPVMRCGEQVDELLRYHTSGTAQQRRNRVLAMFERVRLPDPSRIYAAYPHQLSGGQRQRIMIAMALILQPTLLIADEPTTALDVTTQAEILSLVRELQRENGTSVLFITHDFGVVSEIADHVAVLRLGELVEHDTAESVLRNPQHEYTQALLAAVPTLTPRKQPLKDSTPTHLQTRALSRVFHTGSWTTKRTVHAAVDINLELKRGETLGVVGESGSGKSTLARMLAQLLIPSSGEVMIDGERYGDSKATIQRELRRKVQVVFQDPYRSLNPRRTVGAAITEGPLNYGATNSIAKERAIELMQLMRLSPDALNRYPHEFSGGQRQRICIARALALNPELLIADEAVSALDVSVQAQILELLEEIQGRLHLSMIFITHDLRVAAQICNRLLVMQNGHVVESGPVQRVFEAPEHPYTRALLASAPGRHFQTVPSRH